MLTEWRRRELFGAVLIVLAGIAGLQFGYFVSWMSLALLTLISFLIIGFMSPEQEGWSGVLAMCVLTATSAAWVTVLILRPIWQLFHGGVSLSLHSFVR